MFLVRSGTWYYHTALPVISVASTFLSPGVELNKTELFCVFYRHSQGALNTMLCGMELDLSFQFSKTGAAILCKNLLNYYENIVCDGNKERCLSAAKQRGLLITYSLLIVFTRVMRNLGGRDQWNIEYAVSLIEK